MKTFSLSRYKFLRRVARAVGLLAAPVLTGLVVAAITVASVARAAPEAGPDGVNVNGYAIYTVYSSTASETTNITSTARLMGQYGDAQCYTTFDAVSATPVVTLYWQTSADATNWVYAYNGASLSADQTIYASTAITGAYWRITSTVTDADPFTLLVKCVVKNTDS